MISFSTLVGAFSSVWTWATEASGGSERRRFRTSAMRVLFIPARRAGSSSNMLSRMYSIACRTSCTEDVSGM
jgi:hypothetical protein